MDATVNKNYMKGFVPFAMAAALVSLAGGFTASIPNNIVSAWGLDSTWVTWITLSMSMGMAACAPVLGKLGDIFGRRGAALCFVICLVTMKKETGPRKGLAGFDIFGGIFIILGFSLVLCVPTVGQGAGGWLGTASLAVIGCTVVALIVLFLAERKAKNPILNGKFMARKEFILPVVVLFLTQGLMQACMTNTIRFSMMFDPTSSVASFATSIMYVGMTIGNIAVAPLSNKHEPRYISVLALLFCLVGAAIQLLFTAESGFVLFASSLFFIGLGLGGNGTIFMKVALSGLDPQIAGAGSGTYTVFRDMSAPFGVAVFSSMFVGGYAAAQQAGDAAALGAAVVSSMHNVAWVQMACVVVGMVVCLMLPKIYSKKA